MLLTVAAVSAVMVGFPRLLDDDRPPEPGTAAPPPAAPAPASTDDAPIRGWTTLRCPGNSRPRSCAVPWVLGLPGRRYATGAGARQPVFGGHVVSRSVKLRLYDGPRDRLVMVGATRRGPGSHVVARIGGSPSFEVRGGLVLLRLPRSATPLDVWVVEQGTPDRRETLVVEEYRPLPGSSG